jgi:CheY-like chemotaxis protein
MTNDPRNFGETAQRLARNPLGIIALFIVLVYGVAGLVTAFASSLSFAERLPLIYFLIGFPVLVLGVFCWLVSRHSNKLFSPRDFQNEDNYVRMMLSATASLTAASVKTETNLSEATVDSLVQTVRESAKLDWPARPYSSSRVLWVDDRPDNNIYERKALEAMGVRFTLARSTSEALIEFKQGTFSAIISDMGRKEGPTEGYMLLTKIREKDELIPYFIYAGSKSAELTREALKRGAQGSTNNAQELFRMVMRAVLVA